MIRRAILGLVAAVAAVEAAAACSLCSGDIQNRSTIRQEVALSKVVFVGRLSNPQLIPGDPNGRGTTEVSIDLILKDDPVLRGHRRLTIQRYLPFDGKPPMYLLVGDVVKGRFDLLNGRPIRDDKVIDYIREIQKLDPAKQSPLLFFAQHLDDPAAEIAADAFLEFAKASDADVGRIAGQLDPARLRKLVADPKTPLERLRLLAFLLGACGAQPDAELLLKQIRSADDRSALGGLLAGYIMLRPNEGWRLAHDIAADAKRGFLDRHAVLATLRFFRGWKPAENWEQIRPILTATIEQSDLADVAIEDLRRWKAWDLTDTVVAAAARKSHESAIVQTAVIRFALSSPKPAAKEFIAAAKRRDSMLVQEIAEELAAEK